MIIVQLRAVFSGGAGAPPEFRSSVNPSNQRGQIMSTTLLLAPPDLKNDISAVLDLL